MIRPDYDSPWKEMIEGYFQEFMGFFFPQAAADIDWSRGYDFLDGELQQVVRDAELGRRLVDKLVRVWRRNGDEAWVLVHVEVQGSREAGFPKRMYVYNYRLFDRHDRRVASLAVLADDDPSWRPEEYEYELWGSRASLRFPVVKLLDYQDRWADLESSPNPLAVAVAAHLRAQTTRHAPGDRFRWKLRLTKALYERGMSRKDILELYRFIDWVMALPRDLEIDFQEELTRYEKEKNMPYVTSAERIGMEKGIQQGIEQGIERGIEQGVPRGEALLLKRLLTRRFGTLPSWVEQRLDLAGQTDLENWGDRILDAETLEEVFG
jgi:hypothetical protein